MIHRVAAVGTSLIILLFLLAGTVGDAGGVGSSRKPVFLPIGIYIDGHSGTPHYFMVLSHRSSHSISGTVAFVYQDGQTSAVFTFKGTMQSGVATLNPHAKLSPITATYGRKSLTLGECPSYLHFATSLAQCNFNFPRSGIQ